MLKIWKIIIDTNVLVAALKSKRGASFKILSMASGGKFEFCLSVPLVCEYEEVLKRQELGLKLNDGEIEKFLDALCLLGAKQQIWFSWRPISPDAKDDFVAELAINAQADAVVTHNVRDFRNLEKFSIKILTPSEFLLLIGE
jgi:putative PIN family toxin of toxin-antitoxin system